MEYVRSSVLNISLSASQKIRSIPFFYQSY